MKNIFTPSLLFAVVLVIGCANVKLNTFDRREGLTENSLRIADSIRVADSIRAVNSLQEARYSSGDSKLKEKEQAAIEKRRQDSIALAAVDTSIKSYESDANAYEAREIVIEDDDPHADEINKIQAAIDSLMEKIYDKDKKFGKMKEFTLKDKKLYIKFLLKNHMKDTASLISCCEDMYSCMKLEHEKLLLILNTQKGNARGLLNIHIKKVKMEMGDLGRFILSLSPDIPGSIDHKKNKEYRFD